MSLYIQITVRGDAQVQAKLKRLGRSLYDFKDAYENVGRDLSDYYSNRAFVQQGAAFGEKWAPLSPTYRAYRIKRYGQAPILDISHKLRRGFTYRAYRDYAIVYNKMDYFKYHQSTRPRKRLPRRVLMGINPTVQDMVRRSVKQAISDKIRKS